MRTRATAVTRRWTLGATLRAAAVTVAGAALSACAQTASGSSSSSAGAATTSTGGKTKLVVSIPFQGNGNYQGTMQKLTEEYINANWTAKNPGVEITTVAGSGANGNNVGSTGVLAASLAGEGPATVCGCCGDIQTYMSGNLLLPLNSLLQQDNVDLSQFSPGHLNGLNVNGQQLALPQYDGPEVLVYNQGLLDQLGLAYPQPGWTLQEANQLWSSVARTQSGKRLYGASLDNGDQNWLVKAWGGSEGDPSGTHALLDQPASVSAFTWEAGLLQSKVIKGGGPGDIKSGASAFAVCGGWDIQYTAESFLGMKWDFLPMPTFPAGKPSTFINNDFNGINALSNAPRELTWSIFKFVTMDPGFQRFTYQTTFITPNQSSLWPDWIQIVRAAAPPLATKNLKYYQQAIDYGQPTYFFKYNAAAVNNVKGSWFQKIQTGLISPTGGLTQATNQINAIEASGLAVAPDSAALAKQFPVKGASIAIVPAGL